MPIELADVMGGDMRAAAFYSSKWLKRMIENFRERMKREYHEAIKTKKVEPWDEDKTRFREVIVCDGSTFVPYSLWDVPPAKLKAKTLTNALPVKGSPYLYWHCRIPAGDPISLYQRGRRGKLMFTKPVLWPVLSKMDDSNDLVTWMSLSPMEMMTQRRGVQLATGTCLVGGLGLGWFLQKICKKPSVTRVILVEKDEALLTAVLPRLQELFPEVAVKVRDVHADDVYNHIGKHGNDVRHLLDIWPGYGNWDSKFETAKTQVPHLWGWGHYAERTRGLW